MKRIFLSCAAVLLAVVFMAGCAATGALESARGSFQKAKAAGAESKAPYEYYSAEAYLEKAEHEATEGDSKEAREFAAQSEKFSAEALKKAGGGAK